MHALTQMHKMVPAPGVYRAVKVKQGAFQQRVYARLDPQPKRAKLHMPPPKKAPPKKSAPNHPLSATQQHQQLFHNNSTGNHNASSSGAAPTATASMFTSGAEVQVPGSNGNGLVAPPDAAAGGGATDQHAVQPSVTTYTTVTNTTAAMATSEPGTQHGGAPCMEGDSLAASGGCGAGATGTGAETQDVPMAGEGDMANPPVVQQPHITAACNAVPVITAAAAAPVKGDSVMAGTTLPLAPAACDVPQQQPTLSQQAPIVVEGPAPPGQQRGVASCPSPSAPQLHDPVTSSDAVTASVSPAPSLRPTAAQGTASNVGDMGALTCNTSAVAASEANQSAPSEPLLPPSPPSLPPPQQQQSRLANVSVNTDLLGNAAGRGAEMSGAVAIQAPQLQQLPLAVGLAPPDFSSGDPVAATLLPPAADLSMAVTKDCGGGNREGRTTAAVIIQQQPPSTTHATIPRLLQPTTHQQQSSVVGAGVCLPPAVGLGGTAW